jgi:hypothetical protein
LGRILGQQGEVGGTISQLAAQAGANPIDRRLQQGLRRAHQRVLHR